MSVVELGPSDVVGMRSAILVDVRSEVERHSEMGWIPGTIHLPADRLDELPDEGFVVLTCLSGARSGRLAAEIASKRSGSTANLAGGLLGWGAAGLPVCRLPMVIEDAPLIDINQFKKQIKSCFLVEAVESHDGGDPFVDHKVSPDAALAGIFPDDDSPTDLSDMRHRLDKLAAMAWANGHRLEAIASNVDQFYRLAYSVSFARPAAVKVGAPAHLEAELTMSDDGMVDLDELDLPVSNAHILEGEPTLTEEGALDLSDMDGFFPSTRRSNASKAKSRASYGVLRRKDD